MRVFSANGRIDSIVNLIGDVVGANIVMSLPKFPPKFLSGFPNAYPVKRKTAFSGGLRHRWKDGRGLIYEWDYQHGHVEVYDHRGIHQGAFSADDGRFLSGADRARRVEP